jgi:hypothetical protein
MAKTSKPTISPTGGAFERISRQPIPVMRLQCHKNAVYVCAFYPQDGGGSWNPNIFIENAIGEPPVKVSTWTETDDSGATVNVEQRRLRGSFSKPMELQNFPFDVQVTYVIFF